MDEIVNRLQQAFSLRSDVRLAILFGSFARGAATEQSDLDVAIHGDADPLALAADLSLLCGRQVDVVRLRDATHALVIELLRDGIRLYEREPGGFALWRSRSLADIETDRPAFERMRNAWLRKLAAR